VLAQLRQVVGPAGLVEGERLDEYNHDATFVNGSAAAAVLPRSTEEVARILAICSAAGIPVVTRGAGTGLVGGASPVAGGIVLSTELMSSIEIDAPNSCAIVGPGAINGDVRAAAAEHGLTYPPDPASWEMSSIGGNVATNAGGMSCLKYGVTADYVLGMTVVLADGTTVRLGGRTRKRASGYRLLQLFVGSEGTLGVITEICLRLIPRPRYRAVALVAYASIVEAGQAVTRLLGSGYLPSALELMDRGALDLVQADLPAGLPAELQAILIIEQDGGNEDVVHADLHAMVEILGGIDNRIAIDSVQTERLWSARRSIGKVVMTIPGNSFSEDVAVPIGLIPEMLRRIEQIKADSGLQIPVVGHAGDGNLHPLILFEEDDRSRVGPTAAAIFAAALELGGSISAEHGLGSLKRDHAALEHAPADLELMAGIKRLLDPDGILNPHKVFPEGPADGSFLERQPGWGALLPSGRDRGELGA
jgi:glycolate dehydrogenase FAD-linked subunit